MAYKTYSKGLYNIAKDITSKHIHNKTCVFIGSYFVLSIWRHRCSLGTSLCIITRFPQVPGKKVLKVNDYENNHKLTPLLYKRINLDMCTLSISFKLLRDTTILLSSTSCLLNTARTSSSCTKKQEKHINTIFVGYLNLYKKVNKRHKAYLRRK